MAFSGTISATTFNTNRVVDTAFRRCRLPAQAITPEMQQYARDALYLFLSSLSNNRVPSWCIEKQVYALVEGQPVLTLDLGTVGVLNANYRVTQPVEPVDTILTPTSVTYDLGSPVAIAVVGVKSSGIASTLTFETSPDGLVWSPVGGRTTQAVAARCWTDLAPVKPAQFFRVTGSPTLDFVEVNLATLPQEIPMGVLNRDNYVDQSNKTFTGRPLTYWFQRNNVNPVMNLWPAPDANAEKAQIVVTRHRHIMDVGELVGDIDVPQSWMEAIIAGLAAAVAMETPAVDVNLLPILDGKAAAALEAAWMGDTDGSNIQIRPAIGCYTR